ncbi:MAG TPA: glycosyltransferase 87 family protein, partial [Capillimicrobium sp.]|nr:glycosyltransferase 87 family protein [Capillimicrobium sp.]
MSAELTPGASTAPFPGLARPRLLRARGPAPRALGVLGLAGTTAAALLVVLVAAQAPGPLLGHPAQHRLPAWMAGPLGGLAPSLAGNQGALRTGLVVVLGVLFGCWLLVTATARHLPMRLLAGVVAGVHVVWLLGPPLLLTDLFNYVHYARMGALHGLNPYAVLPVADRGDPVLPLANWHHMLSPYGPLFTVLGYPLALLPVPAAYWGWKVVVLASSLGVLALVWWLARRLGRSPQRAVAFAGLNPVVLLFGVGGAHNDALTMLAVLGAMALAVATWDTRGDAAPGGRPVARGR